MIQMISSLQRQIARGIAALWITAIIYYFVYHYLYRSEYPITRWGGKEEKIIAESSNEISNSTLGFEKIIAINLESRSDRKNMLTLASTLYNISLEWVVGRPGQDVVRKARPAHWTLGPQNLTEGELGCWSSHVDAIAKIVANGYETALIVEDDVDWDVRIREQLTAYARNLRGENSTAKSVYGEWDILWPGVCGIPQDNPNNYNFDVPDFEIGSEKLPRQTFTTVRAHGGFSCTTAYALTQNSARKLLAYLLDIDQPVDTGVSRWCANQDCVSVWPPLFGAYKSPGWRYADSDTQEAHTDTSEPMFREEGVTPWIEVSAIQRILRENGRHDWE